MFLQKKLINRAVYKMLDVSDTNGIQEVIIFLDSITLNCFAKRSVQSFLNVLSHAVSNSLTVQCFNIVFIHAEHVVQSAWILFSLWMYVCMFVCMLAL